MNQDLIIAGCKNNDRKCQEQLYRSYFPTMMSMAMRYMQDKERASSIVNDGFLKIFTKIDTYENRGSFEGWMRRIVFRCLSDAVRKDGNYLKFIVFEDVEKPMPTELALSKLYEEDLLKLVDKLPPASGEVFTLYSVYGYNHKEIAELRGISVGTSKWHLSEARKKLQGFIAKNKNAGHKRS